MKIGINLKIGVDNLISRQTLTLKALIRWKIYYLLSLFFGLTLHSLMDHFLSREIMLPKNPRTIISKDLGTKKFEKSRDFHNATYGPMVI